MAACLVLIAGLCFAGRDVQAHVSNFGMGYSAEITGEHYSVRTGGTDVIDMHDFRKAPKACVGDVCLRYFKWCNPGQSGGTDCGYAVVWPGIVPDGGFTVHADDTAALATADKDVTIPVERDGKSAQIPLSALNVLGHEGDVVNCPLDFLACNPP